MLCNKPVSWCNVAELTNGLHRTQKSSTNMLIHKQHGTVLNAKQFRDYIQFCNELWQLHLLDCCDGYGSGFSVECAVNCMNGGSADLHHNEVADKWATLCQIALSPICISKDTRIFSSKEAKSMKH